MIDLDEFVNKTLSQIVKGVKAFNEAEKNEAVGGIFSAMPKSTIAIDEKAAANFAKLGFLKIGNNYATVVNFDVAVVAEEGENAKAGGGLKVFPFSASGDLEANKNQSSASRISFPITLIVDGIR